MNSKHLPNSEIINFHIPESTITRDKSSKEQKNGSLKPPKKILLIQKFHSDFNIHSLNFIRKYSSLTFNVEHKKMGIIFLIKNLLLGIDLIRKQKAQFPNWNTMQIKLKKKIQLT